MSSRIRAPDGDDGIERTPQYYAFMTELQQFHDSIGTVLQPELILGGKRLDIYRIYLGVKNAGGFEKVSDDHGWRKICDPFEFPPTCTNSAYVVKRAYKANLYHYAQVHDYGIPISQLKIEPGLKRGFEDDAATAAKKSKTKPQAPITVTSNFIAPQRGNGAPIRVMEYFSDDRYLMAGHQNKVLLALQSGLPNEIDWAFNKLIKMSCTAPPNFHMAHIPGLLEALLEHVETFFSVLKLNSTTDNVETVPDFSHHPPANSAHHPHFSDLSLFNSKETAAQLERVLQVFHIIRNFSFADIHTKFLATQAPVYALLSKCMALPSYSSYIALKYSALDILENIAPGVSLQAREEDYAVLSSLGKMADAPDRGLVMGSLRTLTRLCQNDTNHVRLLDVDAGVLERAVALLRVRGDDELVYTVLEFCYLYTTLGADAVEKLVGSAAPWSLVKVLMGFLHLRVGGIPGLAGRKAMQVMPPPMTFAQGMPMFPGGQPTVGAAFGMASMGATSVEGKRTGGGKRKGATSGAATPIAKSNPTSSAVSPALPKTMLAGVKAFKKFSTHEDEDVDIDGDDEDEVLEEGKAAPISRAAGATNASITAILTAGADPFANVKKKGRPPKNREAYDAYATQVQIQMNQQLQMELQQNPEMPMEERTALVAKLRQQQQTMLNQFVVLEKESSSAVASNAGNTIAPNPVSTGFGAAMPAMTFVEAPPAPPQQEEEEEEAEPNFECNWREANGDECPLQFSTEAEIVKHISDDHFRDPYRAYRCQWANCTRFHDAPTSRTAVFKHLRTHVGDSSKKKSGFSQGLYKKSFKSGGIDTPEPAGITLTTLLILRNVARSQRVRELFLQFEYDLTLAMVERPKYSKFISDILWELR